MRLKESIADLKVKLIDSNEQKDEDTVSVSPVSVAENLPSHRNEENSDKVLAILDSVVAKEDCSGH